ncbi:MAG: hypothetical protein R3Y26_01680 [Rikenellaceae bacterium]
MTAEEIKYINEIIYEKLAQFKDIQIDKLGSLKCSLQPTSKNYSENVNEAPKYEVSITDDETVESLSTIIINKTDCAPKEALEMVAEWLGDIKKEEGNLVSYEIANVGTITVKDETSKTFVCDKVLLGILQPVSVSDIKNTVTTSESENKKKIVPITIIIISILCLATYFIAPNIFISNKKSVAVVNPVDSTAYAKPEVVIEEPEEVEVERPTKKGYYLITNTFKHKENAHKRLEELSKVEPNAVLLEVIEHSITPYFISIGRYDSSEDARLQLNKGIDTYCDSWIYYFSDEE